LKLGQRDGVELIWGIRRHEKFLLIAGCFVTGSSEVEIFVYYAANV
jgi:hypothetical protein